jgi:putative ABC transport system ATP-binding protein
MSISINNLKFSYSKSPDDIVLNIKHWQLHEQENIFIHGPSGCGKTTFLNLISGMLTTSKDSIKVLQHSMAEMKGSEIDSFRAKNIGYIFQNFNLIPYLSPIENIKTACQFSKNIASLSTIKQMLSDLHLEPKTWHKATHFLSMGQKQRVAIARALINQPKLIIADEPTSSLDEKNRDTFMSLLKEQTAKLNCALLLVSHDTSLSQYFSRVESFNDINAAGIL